VARGVDEHESAPRRGEVPVGDVDGDPLLALGAQPVGDEGEVDTVVPASGRRDRRRFELIVEQRLGVVQQPPDERALAVVDGAGGGEAKQLHQK
jgi:hypothetical protein